tara:strand:+ start:1606 stop:2505 length:900 start_codon:yes stop_codon:yes gene_type:complete
MAFSGGGSNVLKPHTHDSTIIQDGGNLNFQNITQANMSAGSMTQSDGVHLQELLIGTPAQIPRVNAGATAVEWHSPIEIGEELVNKGSLHGCTGGSVQTELLVSATDGDYIQADSAAAAGLSYVSPAWKLLAVEEFAGSDSNENISITPSIDLATEYAEIIVVVNLFTNNQVGGFGDIILYPNGSGGTFTNPYGYSITTAPAITALVVAATGHHQLGLPAMTTTNSSFHSETHISLAKSATTTDTVYMVTDSISDQGRSEHWQNTVDLGTTTLSSVQVQASSASWTAGSNISIYGVKFA